MKIDFRKMAYDIGSLAQKYNKKVMRCNRNPFFPIHSQLHEIDIPAGLVYSGIEHLPMHQGVSILNIYSEIEKVVKCQRQNAAVTAKKIADPADICKLLYDEDEDSNLFGYRSDITPNIEKVEGYMKNLNMLLLGFYFGNKNSFGAKLIRDAIKIQDEETRNLLYKLPHDEAMQKIPVLELSQISLDDL